MGGRDGLDRVVTVEGFKEKEKGIIAMNPQQEDIINKSEPKVSLESSEFEVLFQGSHQEISI